ncbi:MAG: DNA polymerase III subunit delta [Hyphomicrobium sp.]|jgi:DNA polymerase-3 subunit delta
MVAVKAHQAQAFISSPDPRQRAVLFFGSDAGLVAERAQSFAKACAAKFNPPGELLRLDDTDLDGDPDRLAVELATVPMFGGPKIIRVTSGRRVNAAALRPLLEIKLEGMLIVESGNLKPDDSLRGLFEKSALAAAVACYSDGVQDLEALIREVLKEASLSISPDAREALVARLGADRALSRGEIEKLALYARGKREVDIADVEAVVGDVSELALERIYNAAAAGQAARALSECERAVASGESAQGIIAATQRHFQKLHRVRGAVERGGSVEDALRQMRPPLHFKQKDAFAQQCRLWTGERLLEAQRRIAVTAKAARLSSALEDALAERLLFSLAELARQASRAR